MIALGIDGACEFSWSRQDPQSVRQFLGVGANSAQAPNDDADAIAFLYSELRRSGYLKLDSGGSGDARQQRQLVNQRRYVGRGDPKVG